MPRLVIRQGEGIGRDQPLGALPCVVGRDPAANFILDDPLVSRFHFRIVPREGRWVLEDLGSRNGTVLNGHRVERALLSDGDELQAGGIHLAFVQKALW